MNNGKKLGGTATANPLQFPQIIAVAYPRVSA
jgi:hypothetical protein